MKKILAALVSGLCIQASAFAEQCVVDRYQINGSQLAENDRLELNIDGNVASVTLNARNSAPNRWPAILGRRVNAVMSADVASAGTQAKLDQLGRYIPQNSATNNLLDIMQSGTNVSLTLNGSDFSSALVQEVTSATSSGKALLPGWKTNYISASLQTYIMLSNISDSEITVNVDLYTQSGALYSEATDGGDEIRGINVDGEALISASGAIIPAKQTVTLAIITSGGAQRFGYGEIRWTADTCLDAAMTGIVATHIFSSGVAQGSETVLNGGQAF